MPDSKPKWTPGFPDDVPFRALRIWAIVQVSKRGKAGVVMTSTTSARALRSALSRLIIRGRPKGGRFITVEFSPQSSAEGDGLDKASAPGKSVVDNAGDPG